MFLLIRLRFDAGNENENQFLIRFCQFTAQLRRRKTLTSKSWRAWVMAI